MSFLLDTSVLVAALTSENFTAVAQNWLAGHGAEVVLVSEWGLTEFCAALAFKVRTRQLTPEEQLQSRPELDHLLRESLVRLEVTTAHFRLAADLAAQVESGLRSGDALHVATASAIDGTIVTLDHGMARAARHLRIDCVLLAT